MLISCGSISQSKWLQSVANLSSCYFLDANLFLGCHASVEPWWWQEEDCLPVAVVWQWPCLQCFRLPQRQYPLLQQHLKTTIQSSLENLNPLQVVLQPFVLVLNSVLNSSVSPLVQTGNHWILTGSPSILNSSASPSLHAVEPRDACWSARVCLHLLSPRPGPTHNRLCNGLRKNGLHSLGLMLSFFPLIIKFKRRNAREKHHTDPEWEH